MKAIEKISYFLLKGCARWLRGLSQSMRQKLSDGMASLGFNFITKRKDAALANIKHAFPKKNSKWHFDILKGTYCFFLENFIVFMSFPQVFQKINYSISGKSLLDDALQKGKGIVLITGHFGSWELLGAWLGRMGYPLWGVAQKQRNLGANQFFFEQRGANNVGQVFRKDSLDKMYEILEDNKILALVSDQDAKGNGIFVDFFNIPASTTKGAARFHLKTGSPMIFSSCVKTGYNQYHITFEPVPNGRNIKEITQSFTQILENKIRQYPEQYFWFHRRWKTKQNEDEPQN